MNKCSQITPFINILPQLESFDDAIIKPLFRNIYFIAKENISLTKYEALNKLLVESGIKIIDYYRSYTSAKEILRYLNRVI